MMNNDLSRKVVKKRNKPSLSCTNCKQRKIKCDRKWPCTSCTNAEKESTCIYTNKKVSVVFKGNISLGTESVEISPESTKDELKALKEKIHQLEKSLEIASVNSSENDLSSISKTLTKNMTMPNRNTQFKIPSTNGNDFLDLYNGYSSIHIKEPYRRVNFGPLTWSCFVHKDPWLSLLWKYSNEHGNVSIYNKKVPKINKEEPKNGIIPEKVFHRRVLGQDGYEEQPPFKPLNNLQPAEFIKQTKNLNVSSMAFARTLFEGTFDSELHLFQKIRIVIPKKKVLWSLVSIFFKTLYPFIPFIDQREFISSLTKLFGPISYVDESVDEIKIKRKFDLAIVAQFLIIIRLTYLSLFSTRECVNEYIMNNPVPPTTSYDYKYLLASPINLITIDVAKNCIDTFQFSKKSNLSVFQALLFMRIYHKLSPEYGDGIDGGDSVVSSAVLVQMAVSLGLNREPNKFANICNDERTNHLGRKIWASLVQDSYLNSMLNGFPCIINVQNSDVMEPFINDKNSNIINKELEIAILQDFTWIPSKISLDNFLNTIININKPIRISAFTEELNRIESFCINELLMNGGDSKRESYNFQEVRRIQLFLHLRSTLLTVYSHLFLHYESTNNAQMAFFYLKKQLLILYDEIVPYYFEIKFGKYSSFGLILIPQIEICLHKADQLILFLLARLTYMKILMERNINHSGHLNQNLSYNQRYNLLVNLVKNLQKTGELVILALSKFAMKYYHAWRIVKSHSMIFKFLKEPDFFNNTLSFNISPLNFSIDELIELEKLSNLVVDILFKITSYKDSYSQEILHFFTDPKFMDAPNVKNLNNRNMESDFYFSTNDDTDKIWLQMLQNQSNQNLASEFGMIRNSIDFDDINNLNFEYNTPSYSDLAYGDLFI